MRRLGLGVVALVLLPLAATGCYSKATAYEGRFTFAYASGVQVDNFIKPIAPGARLDVVAFANGTQDKLVIRKATSSRTSVVAVHAVAGQTLTLKGVSPGVAEIEITAEGSGGQVLVDKMFFHVASPATHAIEHACTEEPNAVWVKGENVDVYHRLATSDKRPVIGYGYAPLTIEPAGALELVDQPQGFDLYRFQASAAGKVTVRSAVDRGALSLRIVDRRDLTDARIIAREKMVVGGSAYAVAWVKHPEGPVCSQNALTKARSLTPTICKVTARLDDEPGEDENHEQLADITALAFGECKYEITLPELDGGKGITLKGTTKVGRLEFPGEGSAAAAPAPSPSCSVLGEGLATWSNAIAAWVLSRVLVLAGALFFLRRQRRSPIATD